MNLDVPMWQLTARQFLELTGFNKSSEIVNTPKQEKNLIYGLAGLRELLGCSHPTAQRIKDSGKIPFTQIGRKIIFDADAVLTALNKRGGKANA
jgi:excisionase family DNA binding protein